VCAKFGLKCIVYMGSKVSDHLFKLLQACGPSCFEVLPLLTRLPDKG